MAYTKNCNRNTATLEKWFVSGILLYVPCIKVLKVMRHSTSPFSRALIHAHTRDFHAVTAVHAVIFLLLMVEERLACVLRQPLIQECSARHRDISLQAQK
jgi:hypothetical protein